MSDSRRYLKVLHNNSYDVVEVVTKYFSGAPQSFGFFKAHFNDEQDANRYLQGRKQFSDDDSNASHALARIRELTLETPNYTTDELSGLITKIREAAEDGLGMEVIG